MPDFRPELRQHLAGANLAPTREAEIIEELSQHADDRYRELTALGMPAPEAHRIALEELLSTDFTSAPAHEPTVTLVGEPAPHWYSGLGQDLRYGLRTLFNNPRFTAIAILALALGIGANTAIFSVINGVLLQPLSYPESNRLVRIHETSKEFGDSSVSYLNYLDWRASAKSFTDLGGYRGLDLNFSGNGQPEQLNGTSVTASLLPLLGVQPLLGRSFLPEDDRPGAPCNVMLSHAFWQSRFAGDPQILTRTLNLNGRSCAVIGILDRKFRLSESTQVYMPIEQLQVAELHTRELRSGLRVIGRLKPGVTEAVAQAELAAICERLARQYPQANAGHSVRFYGMKDELVAEVRPFLMLLASAVSLVLLIACANVANLLLARSSSRQREFAIRTALGAERWRIVRQLLVESLLLSLMAALIGLPLAWWGTRAVLAAAPGSVPRMGEIGIDPVVLAFTLIIALVTGILFGLAPAFHGANSNPQESLKEGTRGAGGARRRGEAIFVAIETGLAVVLVAGAGLMIQSIWNLLQIDPGFNIRKVLSMQYALSPKLNGNASAVKAAHRQVLERVAAVPGVQSAALTALVPLGDNDNENLYWLGNGPQPPQTQLKPTVFYLVTPTYLDVMQIPLRSGRFINGRDHDDSPQVAVIDEVFARHAFPNQNPIGRQVSLMGVGAVQIVGVVGHVKQWGLDSDDKSEVRDQLYFPIDQIPDQFMTAATNGLTLLVRTAPEPLSLLPAVRREVAGPGFDQPAYEVHTMEQIVTSSLAARRFVMLVLIIFASAALLLAAIGIYGVMSYSVTRRVHEIGIRAALGATRQQIIRMVIREGMRPAGIGMAVGVAATLALTRFMANLLYGVDASDPLTLVGVIVLLGAIALCSCYIPARRATAADPVVALRAE